MYLRSGVALAFGVSLAACGGDKAAGGGAASASAAPPVVTFHAKDFAFEGPSEITAGITTFRLVNDGPNLHHMQIVRLDSGKTTADVVAAFKNPGPPPAWFTFVTGPNAPNPGGAESNATVDLPAGNYAALCLVDLPGGVMHFMKGMIVPLTVKAAAAGAAAVAAPAADINLTLQDYQFTLDKPITAGHHTFAVKTQNGQPHEVEFLRVADGKTVDDFTKWLAKMDGPPPVSLLGGVAATSPGVDVRFSADFTPGTYILICFLPDSKDGKPHFTHGMQQVVTVQ